MLASVHQPVNSQPHQARRHHIYAPFPRAQTEPGAALENLELALPELGHAGGVCVDSEAGEGYAACWKLSVIGFKPWSFRVRCTHKAAGQAVIAFLLGEDGPHVGRFGELGEGGL